MSRRASLPGADELFRDTGGASAPARPAAIAEPDTESIATGEGRSETDEPAERERHAVPRRRGRGAERRPTGRERHDEKITVYCSAEELIDLERARLGLRGDYGIAVDRGRIVREAISIVLEQLESQGAESPLVRRLQHG